MISNTSIAAIVVSSVLLVAMIIVVIVVMTRQHKLNGATARPPRVIKCSGDKCCKVVYVNDSINARADIQNAARSILKWARQLKSGQRRNNDIETFGTPSGYGCAMPFMVCAVNGMSHAELDKQVANTIDGMVTNTIDGMVTVVPFMDDYMYRRGRHKKIAQ